MLAKKRHSPGRKSCYPKVRNRPKAAIHEPGCERLLTDRKTAVRIAFLKSPVLTRRRPPLFAAYLA